MVKAILCFITKIMEEVVVLIPFKNSIPERLRNILFVINYYTKFIPTAKIIVIEQNTTTNFNSIIYKHIKSILTEDLFCKGFLLNEGYNQVPAKYYILADADTIPDMNLIINFSNLYPLLENTFIVTFNIVYYLREKSTEMFIKENDVNVDTTIFEYERDEYRASGGVGLISGHNFYKNNGFDKKFVGWGGEDDNFYNRIYVSGIIKVERLPYKLIHLWHPSQVWHKYTEDQMIEKRNNIPDLKLVNHEICNYST